MTEISEPRQLLFKDILHDARNERALKPADQTDDELRRGIAELQMKWYDRPGTQAEHKRYSKLMDEILRRRVQRQNG